MQKWPGNPASPLTENECSATISQFNLVSGTTDNSHLERRLCQMTSGRINLLLVLGGATWGWHISDSRQVYIAVVRSMLEYATVAWAPWLSATTTCKVERVQLEAARAIIGLVRSTPVETVLAESQLLTISTRLQTIFHPKSWRMGPSSIIGRSLSSPLYLMQTAP